MTSRQIIAALAPLLLATAAPAAAQSPAAPAATLVPADFTVPTLATGPGFKLVPLGPAVVKIDYDAYMASIEHLQKTFTRSTDWPHAGLTAADAMKDMAGEQARFQARTSFAYAVLTPDGTRERGSVYIAPSRVPNSAGAYDAVVRLWVTKADYDAGFDAQLYTWVQTWLRTTWPFTRIAYPGRAIDWATWDALVAKTNK